MLGIVSSPARALAAVLVVLGACEPPSRDLALGVSLDQVGEVVVHYVPCEGEVLKRVELLQIRDPDRKQDNKVIWEVVAKKPASPPTVSIGSAPPGFRETVPLTRALEPDERLIVGVTTNRVSVGQEFVMRELRTDVIQTFSGSYVSPEEFETRAMTTCPT